MKFQFIKDYGWQVIRPVFSFPHTGFSCEPVAAKTVLHALRSGAFRPVVHEHGSYKTVWFEAV